MQSINLLNWENRLNYRFELQKKDVFILSSALLFSFSFASSPFSFFVYFAFIPLIRRLELASSHKDSFYVGYKVGLIVNSLVFYWIIYYKLNSYFLIIILNPIQFALFSYAYSHLKVVSIKWRLIIVPFLWTFLEYIREFGDLALNWLNIGYTQGNFIQLIQFADITGLNGVVFWICLINVIVYNLLYKVIRLKHISINYIVLGLLFILSLFYGYQKISDNKTKKGIMASYIQPNVNSNNKWDKSQLNENINILISESEKLEVSQYSMVIWPETALPLAFQQINKDKAKIIQFIDERKTHILTGVLYDTVLTNLNSKYNSAVLFSFDSNRYSVFHKIKLVPVEEVLPYSQFYYFLLTSNYPENYYSKGEIKTVFTANLLLYETDFKDKNWTSKDNTGKIYPVNFSAVICFESSFPSFVKEFVNKGAEFIIVLTNDEWFGYSTQPVQHLITSRFRAIENRTSVIHSSNAGISSFIDLYGRYYGSSELFTKSSFTQIIPLRNEISLFSQYGDWIGKFSTIFILLTFVLIFYKNQKYKTR